MNILNKFFNSPKKFAEQSIDVTKIGPTPVKVVQVASSGTEIYSGYINEEYLVDLRGSKASILYDKMRRSDPRIKMVLSAVKNPIKSADWTIRTKNESEIAQVQKKLVEKVLFKELGKPWKKTLHEILSMIDFGYSVFEITHKVVLSDKDVGPHIGLKSIKLIGQKTVERFDVHPNGELKTVTQYSYGDTGKTVSVPAEYILHFSVDKEGDNYEGVSMLRSCYGPWIRKNQALKQEAVGNQNSATPLPVLSIPDGEQNTPQYANAIAFLQNYSNNNVSYLVKPQGWDLELKANPFDSSKIRESIKAENEEIAFGFLANFLNLGSGSGGSYALSTDQSDFFIASLEFIADEITETFNMKLIPELIKLNFPNQECLIELHCGGIADKAGKEFAESLELLARGGMIKTDEELEETIRKKYKLPMPMKIEDPAKIDDAKELLNGAQISSMVEVVTNYKTGILSRESAVEVIVSAFGMARESAELIVGPAVVPNPNLVDPKKKLFSEKPREVSNSITKNAEHLKTVFKSELKPLANAIIKKLMSTYNAKSENKIHSSFVDINPTGFVAYNKKLREEFTKIAIEARSNVFKKYSFSEKITLNRALSKADLIAQVQRGDLEKAIYLQFGSSVDSTDSNATLEKDLIDASDKAIETAMVGADIVSAQLINESRMDIFEEFKDEVESFTFYNEDPISSICQELNGATFAVNDPDLERFTPPMHHNCKSVMIPNLIGDKNNPKISGLPAVSDKAQKSITLKECCH